ncbi:phage integrase family protein [Rhodococcus ruber BKS 20-38]|uniref:Phage integrase family protein n=1 Tax=Rhodococcus ruber BKS 20-38 TaxID=1278076 RepID=M2YZB8_9NOCA|nr:tyrosine-type recombinase/integrase [Rhodococcus ruber]EME67365.1 phage integrase family protein [Rhodococcus ruber BKS 20-38]
MTVRVHASNDGYVIVGQWAGCAAANAFLTHLAGRGFSSATVRACAFEVPNLARFLLDHELRLAAVTSVTVFEWIDWQEVRREPRPAAATRRIGRGAAASTINRRVAAVRALFEYLVMTGVRADNPVPSPRRGQGLRPQARGLLGHLGPGRPRAGGRLVRQPRLLPESLDADAVEQFVASLRTHRDRAMVWAMLFGGLRSAEVRSLRLADVDFGRRRVRVLGKGPKERVVPVDAAFFIELSACLRLERPPGLVTEECFVVLRGPTAGAPVTEAGLRSLFRRHRDLSGATRVRPHRLRHTYGTEIASAVIDLMVLRELTVHVSPGTTAGYVHLSVEQLAAEYGAARARLAGTRR